MYLGTGRIRDGEGLVHDGGKEHKSTIVEALAYRLIVGSMRWCTAGYDEGLTVRVLLEIGKLFWRELRLRFAHVCGTEEEVKGLEKGQYVRGGASSCGGASWSLHERNRAFSRDSKAVFSNALQQTFHLRVHHLVGHFLSLSSVS